MIALGLTHILLLLALQTGPPAATWVGFYPASPTSHRIGNDTTIRIQLNGPPGDTRVYATATQNDQPVPGFSHDVTDTGRIDPDHLNQLDRGKVILTVSLVRDQTLLARASHTLKILPPQKQVVTNFVPSSGGVYANLIINGGCRVTGESVNNVTFIDCDFINAEAHLTVQPAKRKGLGGRDEIIVETTSHNWTFERCTFTAATRPGWGHSHGAYLEGVGSFTFIDCHFDNNGWLSGKRFNQNHNVYIAGSTGPILFKGGSNTNAAAQGIKCRGFTELTVDGVSFRGNLIDIAGDDRAPAGAVLIKNCTFTDTGGVDSGGATLGWPIHFEYSKNTLDSVTIENCTFTGPAVDTNARAVKLAGKIGERTLTGCDFSRWTARLIEGPYTDGGGNITPSMQSAPVGGVISVEP